MYKHKNSLNTPVLIHIPLCIFTHVCTFHTPVYIHIPMYTFTHTQVHSHLYTPVNTYTGILSLFVLTPVATLQLPAWLLQSLLSLWSPSVSERFLLLATE